MNEQVARNVVLVRAIETIDQKRAILSDDDRMYASRSAKELAQWQASDAGLDATAEHFLQQRSEQILKRIAERTPSFAVVVQRRSALGTLAIVLPALALMLGAGIDRIGDPHRVDLLSMPLLLMMAWNGLVYTWLLVWLLVYALLPASRKVAPDTDWLQRLVAGRKTLSRKLPHGLSDALLSFASEWIVLSARLTSARLSRTLHLSAALFAVGATLSLYARGFLAQYVAGWESTFLDAGQVHATLSVLFMPALSIFGLQGFSIADIETLRFSASTPTLGGARWVHLYAATLFLLVVLPRTLLALAAHRRARRLEKNFPLDLTLPYFRKLDDQRGAAPGVLRVLPYSFTLDEARDKGLSFIATQLLGERARVMLRPSLAYGEELATGDIGLADASVTLTAVLFNLSATPEKENHGAFLDHLVRRGNGKGNGTGAVIVLIDESAYLERIGDERIAARITLWREFCRFHQLEATIVNLLNSTPTVRAPGAATP